MIGPISGRVLDESNSDLTDLNRTPQSAPGLCLVLDGRDRAPIGHGKGCIFDLHSSLGRCCPVHTAAASTASSLAIFLTHGPERTGPPQATFIRYESKTVPPAESNPRFLG